MEVVHSLTALERRPRAVAVGSFDGVHAGHRRVIDELRATGLTVTVVTFRAHLRSLVGQWDELLATVQRRLELLDAAGVDEVVLLETEAQLAEVRALGSLVPALEAAGGEVVAASARRRGAIPAYADLDGLEAAGLQVRRLEKTVSSAEIRVLVREGDVTVAAAMLGRPVEVEGVVVEGKRRGRSMGFPSANLDVEPGLLIPPGGVYAGAALGHRAGISVGELRPDAEGRPRVEAHLLGFDGDLYGQRLVIEVWQRLRGERSYAGTDAFVAQTQADVARVETALRPV